jgi:hypothetical protein
MSKKGISNFDTPKKARMKGAADYLDHLGIKFNHNDLFRYHGVSKEQGWAILKQDREQYDRTFAHNPLVTETRGRPPAVSNEEIHRIDRFLQDVGWDARVMTWNEICEEFDLDCSGETLRLHMGSLDYHKCIACCKGWVSARNARKRVEFSETMLALKPKKEDWRDVRFSDEVHWSIGPEGKMKIIRKPGERYCFDCIQETMNRDHEKEFERSHSWAAVGYNFKSDMYFYKVPGNKNGKLSLKVYRDQILEPIVKPWLERGDSFILEEDNDSGHGGGSSSNMVATWKRKHSLDSYFNCSNSPDLAPIENCWQPPKQYLKRFPHWDEFETRELAHEAWQNISQKFINERVDSMPQRLQDCIEMEGRMTGY